MSYPGNSSLASEIQERILTTFEQTLDLATRGDLREAGVGCDFILRLDPLFSPATQLKQRLDQGDGPLLVDDLRLAESPSPEPGGAGDDIFELDERAETDEETNVVVDEPMEGLMTAPAAKDTEVFSDLGADELEAALDLSGLDEATGEVPADSQTAAEVLPAEVPADSLGASREAAAEEPSLGVPSGSPAGPLDAITPEAPTEPLEASIESPPEPPVGQPDPPELPHAEPAAALDAESEQRIRDLLTEGQGAFEDGEYQSAIDAWSRIFLIDIDHQEASRRIELARKLKAEVERQVEELFHEAVGKVEAGDFEGARAGFAKVLEMQSSHLAAQEYLEKLDSGSIQAKEEAVAASDPPPQPAPREALSVPTDLPAEPVSDLEGIAGGELEIPEEFEGLSESGLDMAQESPPRERRRPAAKKAAKPKGVRKSFLFVGGAVLVLATAVGWFLYSNFDDTFPNAGQEAPVAPRPRVDVIARAQQVHGEGNAELAIAQLRRLPPNHPRYAEAQALIAQWETPVDDDTEPEAVSEEQMAEQNRLVGLAQSAFDRREFLLSHELLSQAAAVATLHDEAQQLQTAAVLELQPLRSEIEIFRQGEWGEALRSLWQIRETDPGNPDVRRLMVDSYYNLGVRDLQRRDPQSAAENLREALSLAGSDAEAERVLQFAETYQTRPVDLLYRIFVKYLPFR